MTVGKISLLVSSKSCAPIFSYSFHSNPKFTDTGLHIGMSTRQLLNRLADDGDISSSEVKLFYRAVQQFYMKAADYALDNLPLNDPVLRNSKFVDFTKKDTQDFSQVEYFVARYDTVVLEM